MGKYENLTWEGILDLSDNERRFEYAEHALRTKLPRPPDNKIMYKKNIYNFDFELTVRTIMSVIQSSGECKPIWEKFVPLLLDYGIDINHHAENMPTTGAAAYSLDFLAAYQLPFHRFTELADILTEHGVSLHIPGYNLAMIAVAFDAATENGMAERLLFWKQKGYSLIEKTVVRPNQGDAHAGLNQPTSVMDLLAMKGSANVIRELMDKGEKIPVILDGIEYLMYKQIGSMA